MMTDSLKGRISDDTFDDFQVEQGLLEEVQDIAIARIVDWQTADAIRPHKSLSETEI
jgi:hypothetical protein